MGIFGGLGKFNQLGVQSIEYKGDLRVPISILFGWQGRGVSPGVRWRMALPKQERDRIIRDALKKGLTDDRIDQLLEAEAEQKSKFKK